MRINRIALAAVLVPGLLSAVAVADTSHPGRWPVAMPVTVLMKGRAVKARFVGMAENRSLSGYVNITIHQPRIVVGGKPFYVGQGALRRLFRDFSAEDSGQNLVWGQSVTRDPRARWRPTVKPPLIDYVDGKFVSITDTDTSRRWIYYNGPDYFGKRPSWKDSIGLVPLTPAGGSPAR